MALFKNPFGPSAAPKPPKVPPVPEYLPKIKAAKAAELTQHSDPSPAAKSVLTPQQTPSQYLGALQEKHLGGDMVKTMAHGMPDREGTHWAAQSAEKVSDKLPPSDVHAMKAAQTWVKNPTAENQAAAGAAADKAGHKGPGALAAQSAAWSKPEGTPASERLAPHTVAGAVLMSSAIKANPALATAPTQAPTTPALQTPQVAAAPPATVPPSVNAHMFKQQHPFIAMGLDVASGKSAPG
jgi:uncharacterized protein DUF6931